MLAAPLRLTTVVAIATALLACAPAAQPGAQPRAGDGERPTAAAQPAKTMVMAVGRAPESLGSRPLRELRGPGNPSSALRMFNAGLVYNDAQEVPRPYLAMELPRLGTDTWRTSPDGTMETTYTLRPGLTWHDGEPLKASDFAFSHQVYSTPDLGVASAPPVGVMSAVEAPDQATVRIRWKGTFALADDLQATDFPPLPEHILRAAFDRGNWDAFAAVPFWLGEYVGLGPFRLVTWEPGSFFEGEAFPGHALGRAKVDRLKVIGITDPNATVANLLAGVVHVAVDQAMKDEQAAAVESQWRTSNGGSILRSLVTIRATHFQMRPEFANPAAVADIRVRQAIAHATDRQAIADAVTVGGGTIAEIMLLPRSVYYPDAYAVTPRYPFDISRADQLMAEAGYRRDAEGFFSGPAGRFSIEVGVTDSNPTEGTVEADVLRRAGFDTSLRVIPRAQTTEPMIFANFSGLFNGAVNRSYEPNVEHFRASSIARPENRFLGTNYAGFNDPQFERLAAAWDSTLDRSQRHTLAVQLVQRLGDALPAYGLYCAVFVVAVASGVRGPTEIVNNSNAAWNIHEWEWAS